MANKPGVKKTLTIREIDINDRPRERLQRRGAENVAAFELLAIVLGSGTLGEPVTETSKRLLHDFGDLKGLAETTYESLLKVRGIGPAKASKIRAIFELAERVNKIYANFEENQPIRNPEDVAAIVSKMLREKKKEHFWAILLDTRGRLIKAVEVSKGNLDSSIVHPREVFKEAFTSSAASVVFAHNHPSGIADPSEDDIKLTKRLAEVGDLMGIDVLDHIIIGGEKPYSLKRHGLF